LVQIKDKKVQAEVIVKSSAIGLKNYQIHFGIAISIVPQSTCMFSNLLFYHFPSFFSAFLLFLLVLYFFFFCAWFNCLT